MQNPIRELAAGEIDAVSGGSDVPLLLPLPPIVLWPNGFKPQPDPWRFDPPSPWTGP